jgi:hypothetical protein
MQTDSASLGGNARLHLENPALDLFGGNGSACSLATTWPNEPGESDKRALFEQAKAMLATTESQP